MLCPSCMKSCGSPKHERPDFKVMMLGLRRQSNSSPSLDGKFMGCSCGGVHCTHLWLPYLANPPQSRGEDGAGQTRTPPPGAEAALLQSPRVPGLVRAAGNELQEEEGGCGLAAGPSPPRRDVCTRGRVCLHAKLWKFPF